MAASKSLYKKAILVAEDESVSRRALSQAMRSLEASIIFEAHDGAQAMQQLGDSTVRLTAAFLDFDMPEKTGLEVLKAVRAGAIENCPHDLPVTMVTGHQEAAVVARAIALDVNGFLIKPVEALQIKRRLPRLIEPVADQAPGSYAQVDISAAQSLVGRDLEAAKEDGPATDGEKPVAIDALPENATLTRPVTTGEGLVLIPAGTTLTRAKQQKLQDVIGLGTLVDQVWIRADV